MPYFLAMPNNFTPYDSNTVSLVATTSSSSVQVITLPAETDMTIAAMLVTNAGNDVVFVKFSNTASPVATTADMPLLAGSAVLVSVGATPIYAAAISLSAGNTVYFTPGNGN
jgi:hypothetical protein